MLRADPFLPALDVDFRRRFPSRRIVANPWIFRFDLCVAVSRGPVASSGTEPGSLGVIPRQIVVLFFLLEVV
jgi:hypothetical protein